LEIGLDCLEGFSDSLSDFLFLFFLHVVISRSLVESDEQLAWHIISKMSHLCSYESILRNQLGPRVESLSNIVRNQIALGQNNVSVDENWHFSVTFGIMSQCLMVYFSVVGLFGLETHPAVSEGHFLLEQSQPGALSERTDVVCYQSHFSHCIFIDILGELD